jgi:hypothetical protein
MTDCFGKSEILAEHKEEFHKICTQTAGKVATKRMDVKKVK